MKLELKHLAPYLPYGLQVQYKGIVNGKELSKWDKENKKLDIFETPDRDRPEEVYNNKTGLIKKVEIYLEYWKLRVGNGHKNIYPSEIGKTAFLILRPLSDLTKLIDEDVRNVKYYNMLNTCYSESDIRNFETAPLVKRYDDVQILLSFHFDVFGLIDKGLAISINTINQKQ